MKKAVFLDRDGTIIVDKIYLNDPLQIVYLPGALEALRIFRDHDYEIIVVTNQSGLARGLVTLENLDEIHRHIQAKVHEQGVRIAGFYFAPYTAEVSHFRRKPQPGLLFEASLDHGILLQHSWMIGDRMTDVEAGHRAGCRSILLSEEDASKGATRPPEYQTDTLLNAAHWIVSRH